MNTTAQPGSLERMERFAVLGMQTASLVHELNNQLATIVGNLDLLLLENPSPRSLERKRNLTKARAAIFELVREASDLAAGRVDTFLRTERVPMDDLLGHVQEAIAPVAVLGTPGLVVQCDFRKTARALSDVIRHAWQTGAIHVRLDLRRSGATALLRIADDGPGLTTDAIERVFVPSPAMERDEDRGVGLFSAKWILECMGGNLRLERSDSTGTSFLVNLPLADREA